MIPGTDAQLLASNYMSSENKDGYRTFKTSCFGKKKKEEEEEAFSI